MTASRVVLMGSVGGCEVENAAVGALNYTKTSNVDEYHKRISLLGQNCHSWQYQIALLYPQHHSDALDCL